MPNELEKFLEDTETNLKETDVLEAPLVPSLEKEKEDDAGAGEGEEGEGKDEMKPRNRRERRLMQQLADEKTSAAFLAGKLEATTEARKAITEEEDYLKAVERIYGTDSPEATLATDLLKKAITGARDDAETRAYNRIKEEQQRDVEEEKAAEGELDSMIDTIEDEYGVTLSEPQERAFFQLLEKMSPKDKSGQVVQYADPHAVFEVFQERLKKPTETNTRAKDLSSRSMVASGASTESKPVEDATARFLHEQGLI